MISIISKNKMIGLALCEALTEYKASLFDGKNEYEEICIVCLSDELAKEVLAKNISSSVILIGCSHEDADMELSAPCRLSELKECINMMIYKRKNATTFENKRFLFDGGARLIKDKKTKKDYRLTEKETDLIIYLIKSLPECVSKNDLLTSVWKYNPGVETHTVETHIYSLRQKIGDDADLFLVNIQDGYTLVQN